MQQDVNVILRPANHERNHFVVLTNAGQVSPQPRLQFLLNCAAAILGAEDHMEVVPEIGVGHCAAPLGLYTTLLSSPTASAVGYVLSSLTGLTTIGKLLAGQKGSDTLFPPLLRHLRPDRRTSALLFPSVPKRLRFPRAFLLLSADQH